ncbi:PAS domain S-box protein [Belliella baltica]|uniref:PAS domain S-box protein n=1 Tax=Belliella baltica TaxID=232259 RepID=UPI000311415A|nr:PAS domain S-box protein [Belliella baltica]
MENRVVNKKIEEKRLQNLYSYKILNTKANLDYDQITTLASQICGTNVAMINFIDEKVQWTKSAVGIKKQIIDRNQSFCNQTIKNQDRPLIIEDLTNDDQFRENSFVANEPHLRFYAGHPILSKEGFALGTICVLDFKPLKLSNQQIESLRILALQVKNLLTLSSSNEKLKSTSNRLKEKSRQLKKFFEANVDLFCISNQELEVISLNQSWEHTLGFSSKEIKRRGLKFFIHPEDLKRSLEKADTLSQNLPILNFTNRYLCSDGTYKTLEWRSYLEDSLIYSSARDITEKIEISKKIEAQKLYTESILAALPDLLFIVDKNGIYLNFTSNNVDDLLLKPEEFIGKNAKDILPSELGLEFIKTIHETISKNESKSMKYDLFLKGKFQNFEARFSPFESDKVIVIIRNISLEKQIQDQLIRTKNLLEIAGKISKTGGWEIDFVTNEVIWSQMARQIMEIDEDYIPSLENGISFYKQGSKEKIISAFKEAVEQNRAYDLELEILTALGNTKWVRTQGQPIFENGKCTYIYGTFQDITERYLQEKSIKESEEDYKKLFENMAQGVVYQKSDGTIIRANSAAEKILGLTFDQMIGRTSVDPRWHSIHEDGTSFPGDQHPAMITLRTGEPIKNKVMGGISPSKKQTFMDLNRHHP